MSPQVDAATLAATLPWITPGFTPSSLKVCIKLGANSVARFVVSILLPLIVVPVTYLLSMENETVTQIFKESPLALIGLSYGIPADT